VIGFGLGFAAAASQRHETGLRSRWVSGLWLGSNIAALGALAGMAAVDPKIETVYRK
jgi:Pyruvate/2-oxoacid:ferredoxin oxidoreductase gamma subunit